MIYDTAGSTKRSSVRLSVRLSVCPSVSLSVASFGRRDCGFAAVGLAGTKYRSIAARPGARPQRRRSTAIDSKREQCHVDSRRRKLNADLFVVVRQ